MLRVGLLQDLWVSDFVPPDLWPSSQREGHWSQSTCMAYGDPLSNQHNEQSGSSSLFSGLQHSAANRQRSAVSQNCLSLLAAGLKLHTSIQCGITHAQIQWRTLPLILNLNWAWTLRAQFIFSCPDNVAESPLFTLSAYLFVYRVYSHTCHIRRVGGQRAACRCRFAPPTRKAPVMGPRHPAWHWAISLLIFCFLHKVTSLSMLFVSLWMQSSGSEMFQPT